MTGSAHPVSPPAIICCCICAEPISLETSRADECGKAVHEHCYVCKTLARFRIGKAIYPREQWHFMLRGSN